MSIEDIQSHYAALRAQGGFEGRCRMILPDGLDGKTVIDVCCRKGKGVYKLSEHVGAAGHAIGIDWREDCIAAARAGEGSALARSGLSASNMDFHVAYPELLDTCVEAEEADAVFINDVLNITCSPAQVLSQICTALKPGGLLICQTVVSEIPRDSSDMQAAREDGDSVRSAPDRAIFSEWLTAAGFEAAHVVEIERQPVSTDEGEFSEVVLHITR